MAAVGFGSPFDTNGMPIDQLGLVLKYHLSFFCRSSSQATKSGKISAKVLECRQERNTGLGRLCSARPREHRMMSSSKRRECRNEVAGQNVTRYDKEHS